MTETSKELLDQPPKPSLLESLYLGNNDFAPKSTKKKHISVDHDKGRPLTTEVPKSQVLGKVKDFLGVMAKENEKLDLNAKDSSRSDFDIEVLSGNEQEYIEMDLLLGVADLHTPQAVAAAEATIGGFMPSMTSPSSSSDSDNEDDSDEESDNDNDNSTTTKPTSEEQRLHGEIKPGDKPINWPKIVVLN